MLHRLRDNATFLLQNGSSPDIQNDEQDSPLVAGQQPCGCRNDCIENTELNTLVSLIFPFPILAILNDQYDLATLLIRYNAKVDQVGPLNRTALHESAFLGLDNFVYLLLESGANPNASDSKQKTPLALAAQNGHLNIVEILLEKGL